MRFAVFLPSRGRAYLCDSHCLDRYDSSVPRPPSHAHRPSLCHARTRMPAGAFMNRHKWRPSKYR